MMSNVSGTLLITSYNLNPGDRIQLRHDVQQGCKIIDKGTRGDVIEVNPSPLSGETFVGVFVHNHHTLLWLKPKDLIKFRNNS